METTSKRWNCHDHRDELLVSDNATVYHPERGQLCHGEKHWDCNLYFPVQFKDRTAAYKWIREGCIAEIQESYNNLMIDFTQQCLIRRGTTDEAQERE